MAEKGATIQQWFGIGNAPVRQPVPEKPRVLTEQAMADFMRAYVYVADKGAAGRDPRIGKLANQLVIDFVYNHADIATQKQRENQFFQPESRKFDEREAGLLERMAARTTIALFRQRGIEPTRENVRHEVDSFLQIDRSPYQDPITKQWPSNPKRMKAVRFTEVALSVFPSVGRIASTLVRAEPARGELLRHDVFNDMDAHVLRTVGRVQPESHYELMHQRIFDTPVKVMSTEIDDMLAVEQTAREFKY